MRVEVTVKHVLEVDDSLTVEEAEDYARDEWFNSTDEIIISIETME